MGLYLLHKATILIPTCARYVQILFVQMKLISCLSANIDISLQLANKRTVCLRMLCRGCRQQIVVVF